MSKNLGGYLRGPWWRYMNDEENSVRRCYVIAWGQIVKEPIDLFQKNLRSIRFVIKTGRGAGRNEKHLLCVGYGDKMATVIMRAMEKGDVVLCAGTWVEREKVKTKKGVHPIYEMQVHFVVPLGIVPFILDLYASDEIQGVIENYRNADADVWESD